ncbi:fimbria/pilus periplasmic chaperone [Rahnella sp. Larv3_ips]|uniref:fimbria/pilus periplasmic chaperone n=1 Tax=Rahnella sp. Larv3_ips TaxID=1896943 RepID=UPI0013CE4785|nr:fimbria/pilus periplasmic chaperone [Rahnella sp. Larv3_ips]
MIGNRIIYPSDNASVNVEFRNKDIIPYAVQTWLDDGDTESTPTTGKAPFIASPPLFRIAANGGQVLRIAFNGNRNLPQDRESVFYFNFLQIPPVNAGEAGAQQKNKMLIMLKNRVKVFYRPVAIASGSKTYFDKINVTPQSKNGGTVINIENDSPFYASVIDIRIKRGKQIYKQKAEMIAPFAEGSVLFKNIQDVKGATVIVDYLNDQGAIISHEYEISHQK